jgi:hypothetical protein
VSAISKLKSKQQNKRRSPTTISNTHKMNSTTNASTASSTNLSGSTFPQQNDPTKFNLPMLNLLPTKLDNVDSLIRLSHRTPVTMPDGYIPSDSDVCSGRGKQNWNMKGTVNFRRLIRAAVGRYMAAPLRNHKTAVVVSIVKEIRRQGGHFFKERKYGNTGRWCEIGDTAACKKVGHSLRVEVNKCTASAVKSQSGQRPKEETRCAADAARSCDYTRLTETASLLSSSVQLVKEETPRRASLPSMSVQLVKEESICATDAAGDYDFVEFALVGLVETSPLPSLSPSSSFSSFSSFTEETISTLSQSPTSESFDIGSVMWYTDLPPTNSSDHLLFDGCFL